MKRLIAKILVALGINFIDKKQKKIIYSSIRYSVRNDKQKHSICELLEQASEVCFYDYNRWGMHILYPEIYLEKPLVIKPSFHGLWWDKYNRVAREQALSNAINRL